MNNIDIKGWWKCNQFFVIVMILFGFLPLEGLTTVNMTVYNPFFWFFIALNIFLYERRKKNG